MTERRVDGLQYEAATERFTYGGIAVARLIVAHPCYRTRVIEVRVADEAAPVTAIGVDETILAWGRKGWQAKHVEKLARHGARECHTKKTGFSEYVTHTLVCAEIARDTQRKIVRRQGAQKPRAIMATRASADGPLGMNGWQY